MAASLFFNGLEMVGTTVDMACWVLHRTAIVMRIGRNIKEIKTQVEEIYRGEEVEWAELGEVTAVASSVIFDGAILYNDARIRQTERDLIKNPHDKTLKENLLNHKKMQQISECMSVASNGLRVCCTDKDVDLDVFAIDSASRLVHVWSSIERESNDSKTKNIKKGITCTTAILNLATECHNWKIGLSGNEEANVPIDNTFDFVDVKAILEAIYGEEIPDELTEFKDPFYFCLISFPVRVGVAEIYYDKQSMIRWIHQNGGSARAPFGEVEVITEETLIPAFDIFGKMQKKCLDILAQRAADRDLPFDILTDLESITHRLEQGIEHCFTILEEQLQQARAKGILKSEDFRLRVQKLKEDFGLEKSSEEEKD